jgi:hypothetical protein
VLVTAGCTGLLEDGGRSVDGGLTPAQVAARSAWLQEALPALEGATCVPCHDGSTAGIGLFQADSGIGMRDTLLGYTPKVVNLDAPPSSRLLTRGPHDGRALKADEISDILGWIQKEKDAAPASDAGAILKTAAFQPLFCTAGLPGDPTCPINTVGLDDLGATGGAIAFVAQAMTSGLYVSDLKLVPGPGGASIEHPLFVSLPDGSEPAPDPADSFSGAKLNLMRTATPQEQQIGGGTAVLVGFVASAKITIHFKAVGPYKPNGGPTDGGAGGGGGTNDGGIPKVGGCKALASFKTNAQALFSQPVPGAILSCLACHGGQNTGATSAVDMTGVASDDDTEVDMACEHIRTRVNFQRIDESGIFLAPAPAQVLGDATHPFHFTAAQLGTFKNGPPGGGTKKWIADEQVAP